MAQPNQPSLSARALADFYGLPPTQKAIVAIGIASAWLLGDTAESRTVLSGLLSVVPTWASSLRSLLQSRAGLNPIIHGPHLVAGAPKALTTPAAGAAVVAAVAATDISAVPFPAAVQAYAGTNAGVQVQWADELASRGYTNASQQMLQAARGNGWQPNEYSHRELMVVDDLPNAGLHDAVTRELLPIDISLLKGARDGARRDMAPWRVPFLVGFTKQLDRYGFIAAANEMRDLANAIIPNAA